MDLYELSGRHVRVICNTGRVFVGYARDYTSAADNEPDPESITIATNDGRFVELFEHDIASVEFLD